jgi:DNA-binding MarR family transcriptional regulator
MGKNNAVSAIDLELSLPFQIAQLNSALNVQVKSIISRHCDLNIAQWRILHLVGWGVANTSSTVRKAAGIDKSQFSKCLQHLINQGLIELQDHPTDGRQHLLRHTARGAQLYAGIVPEINARKAHLMASLDDDQQAALFAAIKALAHAAEKTDFSDALQALVDHS